MKMAKTALSGLQSLLIRRFTRGREKRKEGRKGRNAKPCSFRMANAHWWTGRVGSLFREWYR